MAETELELNLNIASPDDVNVPVIKALFIGRDGSEQSNVADPTQANQGIWGGTGAIEPPLDPRELTALLEMSGSLRTSIDAYANNIDGNGHEFEPIVDLDDADTVELIRQALFEEKLDDALSATDDPQSAAKRLMDKIMRVTRVVAKENTPEGNTAPAPEDEVDIEGLDIEVTDAEVEAKIEELRRAMIREFEQATTFFDWCCVTQSFPKLRVITRQDIETLGNGYWEIIRNALLVPVQLTYIPGFTVRLMPADNDPTPVEIEIPRTLLRVDREIVNHKFRRYVQVQVTTETASNIRGNNRVFFKEFGDPRCVSSKSGRYYDDIEALEKAENGVAPATELLHFKVHSPRSPYGVPRWVSELLAVLGNRHAEEINLAYFENKSIPPMAILVSGGRLAALEVDRIKDFIKNEIRGKRNFHKIMVLQAEPFENAVTGQNSGTVKIEIKPLQQMQQSDGLFMDYQDKNADKIGGVFRVPRLLRGDVRDFNRATADASLAFAEKQVFSPLRRDFDWTMNRFIMPAIGVRLWKFVSKGPDTTDIAELSEMLNKAADSGYLSIKELRELAGRVFSRKFGLIEDADIDEKLTKVPLEFLRIGLAGNDSLGLDGDGVKDEGADLPEDESDDDTKQKAVRASRRRKARAALKLMRIEVEMQDESRRVSRAKFFQDHDPDKNEDQP